MKDFLLTNRCTKVRVQTSDNHTLKVFSIFYQHPALLHPDGWKLLDHGEKILVDENTLWVLEQHECEFGYQPKDGTILTCKITPKGKTTPKELNDHWDEMLVYCTEVKGDFAKFVDGAKVEELVDKLDATTLKVKSDSQPADLDLSSNDHTPENTLEEKGQTPPSK
jgi:hypothetical protein